MRCWYLAVGLSLFFLLFTTHTDAQDAVDLQTLLIRQQRTIGISETDAKVAVVTSSHTDRHGITYAYIQQQYQGMPVYNQILSLALRRGALLRRAGFFVADIQTKAGSAQPVITAQEALSSALSHLGLPVAVADLKADLFAKEHRYCYSGGSIARKDIEVKLLWQPLNNGQTVALAWNVNIAPRKSVDWWNVRIDARTGQFLQKDNWTVHEHDRTAKPAASGFRPLPDPRHTSTTLLLPQAPPPPNVTSGSYQVIPYPADGPLSAGPATVTNPWMLAGAGNDATTNGWHYDGTYNYATTQGNNVLAFLDLDDSDEPSPTNWPASSSTGAPALSFLTLPDLSLAPENVSNRKFALTNLFYWNNLLHDLTYQYGFDEAAGNFQQDNLGRGGEGEDLVSAQAQDGGGLSNANFATPPDGSSGIMQMYLWAGNASFTVNSPAVVAGNYAAKEGGLSPNNLLADVGPVTGQVALYQDLSGTGSFACGAASNGPALSGKIVMINRGSCTFSEKVSNAQSYGAIAVIVVNNIPGPILSMGGSDPSITIPSVMISQADGALLAAQIGNGLTVTLGASIMIDCDLDNGTISHEFGHGLSNRLTGGGSNTSCLYNAEQAGEGWSDYLALMMTTDWAATGLADGANLRPISNYASAQDANGGGLRRFPYTTDLAVNPLTYDSVATNTEVHGTGTVWCSALWDMTWKLIEQTGSITPDLYNAGGSGGNVIALNLVITGMKLQPCGPGFLDSRDAILAADSLLYGGAYHCAIWQAFAGRGMGWSAYQGSSDDATDQFPSYDLPPATLRMMPLSAQPLAVDSGSTVLLTRTVVSVGCQPVSGYILRDTIPTGFTYVSSTPAGTLSGNVLSYPPLTLSAEDTQDYTLVLKTTAAGMPVDTSIYDDRDGNALGGFVSAGSPVWLPSTARAHGGAASWFVSQPNSTATSRLTSVAGSAPAGGNLSVFSFWHFFYTEAAYDGGVLEYSTNGGTTWQDVASLPVYGQRYNTYMFDGNLAGQMAWSGGSLQDSFRSVGVDLSSLGTLPVRLRFRMESNSFYGLEGWYVDDLMRQSGKGGMVRTGLYNNWGGLMDAGATPVFIKGKPDSSSAVAAVNGHGYDVRIWPNPASEEIAIENSNTRLNGQTATVTDLAGREVTRFVLQARQTLDVRSWPDGVYSLRLPDGRAVKVVKVAGR